MVPNVPEPAGLVEASAAPRHGLFCYQQLLAYYRGELMDPHSCAAFEERLRQDQRWQAHWESIRYLDLDRAAAVQDAADLARFSLRDATPFCKIAAASNGRVFDALLNGAKSANGQSRKDWNRHADGCAYCRRSRRLAHACRQRLQAGLPPGELLLRDWLLQPCYMQALRDATERLGYEWRSPDAAPDQASPQGDETVLNLDTVLSPPPSSRPNAGT